GLRSLRGAMPGGLQRNAAAAACMSAFKQRSVCQRSTERSSMNGTCSKFPGGIYPPSNKTPSNAAPIRTAGSPAELIFPLLQRQSDAIPLVVVGQFVKKGELIARAADAQGAPIHASTSGQIIAIKERPMAHSTLQQSLCIILRSDGEDSWHTRAAAPDP